MTADPTGRETLAWTKLPIIGMPGMECGKQVLGGGKTRMLDSFKDEFGPCDEDARWMAGMLLVCDKHAEKVAEEFGDNLADIEKAWRDQL